MATDLKDYLTDEERRQMDALLMKAEARMKEKGEEGCRGQFIMVSCQCGCSCGKHVPRILSGRVAISLIRELKIMLS